MSGDCEETKHRKADTDRSGLQYIERNSGNDALNLIFHM